MKKKSVSWNGKGSEARDLEYNESGTLSDHCTEIGKVAYLSKWHPFNKVSAAS